MRVLRTASVALVLLAAGCAPFGEVTGGGGPAAEVRFTLKPASYEQLDGWSSASLPTAFAAFKISCSSITRRSPVDAMGGNAAYGIVADWKEACDAALNSNEISETTARAFFVRWFSPVQVLNGEDEVGLFTGYYEPELQGSRQRTPEYNVPLYRRPSDLVEVELGQFRPALQGERVAGRVVNGRLVPYAPRKEIVTAGLGPASSPLVHVNDRAAAFFLQIQGSGRIKLTSGDTIRAAYDGQNGHPYTAIGRILVDRGEVPKSELSMQRIRSWMDDNPDQAEALMNENASYVFFKEQPVGDPSKGADGAQGVPLTASGSLAVDLKFHALGTPMWVEARMPGADAEAPDVMLRRLFVAQDTGGAIRGPVRGDVYWGVGQEAESIAGRMAHKGKMFILLPKPLAANVN
jgi:membrane-bound lytic murein transglycosylase A